jgi:uncharacterized protein YndB with AHSA1/START domain
MSKMPNENAADRDLILERIIDAPPEKLFRAWTEPDLLKQWFTPPPFTVPHAEMDVRAGGSSLIVMRGPDGAEFPKLVFTDAFTSAWKPSAKPFMVGIITFEDLGGGQTKYTARVCHWTEADRETHEKMGFHQGWGIATDQLAALAARI